MTAQRICQVHGCDHEASQAFSFDWGVSRQDYIVCDDHKTMLDAGETYDLSVDRSELVLGHDIEPDLIDVQQRWGVGRVPIFTLVLGHDGFEEQRVTFRYDSDEGRALVAYILAHPGMDRD